MIRSYRKNFSVNCTACLAMLLGSFLGLQVAPFAVAQDAATPVAKQPVTEEAKKAFQELINAHWIWSPAHKKDATPAGACYLRKTFSVGQIEFAQVHIACDNQYTLYVNGQLVGKGADWRKMDVYDIAKFLRPGRNVIAVEARNHEESGPAGLVARVITKQPAGTYESFSTDATWRTSVNQFRDWNRIQFRDTDWLAAQVHGRFGDTLPWGDEVVISDEGTRFTLNPNFTIERLVSDKEAGSLIAMCFTSRGDMLVSQEGGPLLVVRDKNHDGTFDTVSTYCDQMKSVQGILSLGTRVFAIGEGPVGGGLYRLTDTDRDGRADEVKSLVRFRGSSGEHGPHAVRIGPEGLLYVLVGNFARADAKPNPRSAYTNVYEGDLITPRHEDPRGHAVGIPAPGGTIIRTDTRGSFVEVMAGGLRNPYDFAFNAEGELFTFDADMEWDQGTPWYRPTRICHAIPGAEFGWRSGWAKWPSYYPDGLPASLDLGAGSPTGVENYNHFAFPKEYHNSLFVCDWANGQILNLQMKPNGATYEVTSKVFLKGRPLNVTDIAVGPDGALYFCTGGRGTDGGVYRVTAKEKPSQAVADLGTGIQRALRQPQFESDWARAKIAAVKRQLGNRWGDELNKAVTDRSASVKIRSRALDLLTFFGPRPSAKLLDKIANDREPILQAHAARLMGMSGNAAFTETLNALLQDKNARVRRVACEAVARRAKGDIEQLVTLLGDEDRFVAFAARRALEKMPRAKWQASVLKSDSIPVFTGGSIGLLATLKPSPTSTDQQMAQTILQRCEQLIETISPTGKTSGAEYVGLLRTMELAIAQGKIPAAQTKTLGQKLLTAYPSGNSMADRELVQLLVAIQVPGAAQKLAAQMDRDLPREEKLHIAAYAPRLRTGWTTDDKLSFLRYYEEIRAMKGGHSLSAYVEKFARGFFTNLTLAERKQVLGAGENFPTSALSILASLPAEPGDALLQEIRQLDEKIVNRKEEAFMRLKVGTVATLGRTTNSNAHRYLHVLYAEQPARRQTVAMSLTQNPQGENWNVLVDSLTTIEGEAARQVMNALVRVNQQPEGKNQAEAYRNTILQGLRLGENGSQLAENLLKHWSGETVPNAGAAESPMAPWQAWYHNKFPSELVAELPTEETLNRWTYEELLSFLRTKEGQQGSTMRGAKAFASAQCIQCHRLNDRGEGIGPDLTTVSQRFQTKEILESIIYPSHVVSDQYASHSITVNGRTMIGIAVRDGDDAVVLLTRTGEKKRFLRDEIEEMVPTKQSAMPAGLLNKLTLREVADLFAYLKSGRAAQLAERPEGVSR